VTADAKAAFVRAMELDETIVSARYYLGLAAEQGGHREEAAKIWRDLIAEAPPGAFWVNDVRNGLARVEGNATGPLDPAAAQQMPAATDQQMATIRGMVDRLAARLREDRSDVDGWVQLVRSYKVLGEAEESRAAAAEAQQALADDPAKLQQLNGALKDLEAGKPAVSASLLSGATPAQIPAATDPQAAMIRGMVDRLAARLSKDRSDVDGWVRLVRSYRVLNEPAKSRAAAAEAQQALAGDPVKLQQLNIALKELETSVAAAVAPAISSGAAPTARGAIPDHEHEQGVTAQKMVERLAERLKVSPSDPEGWVTLVRSYEALGEKDKAAAAIGGARQALASDLDKLEQFNKTLNSLNIIK
jgi:cytochrome c-type biogenesis protein CcmH